MCLFPLRGHNSEPPVSCTEAGQKHKETLEIVMYVHLALSVVKMIILSPFAAIGDLISCAILYCGLQNHDFCNLLFYMIISMFDAVVLFSQIGFVV